MKKITALLLIALLSGCKPIGNIATYDQSEFDQEILAESTADMIIVAVNGICADGNTGDGQAEDGYISYSSVMGIQTGDTVTTYFIYTAESTSIDDIAYRYDIIK